MQSTAILNLVINVLVRAEEGNTPLWTAGRTAAGFWRFRGRVDERQEDPKGRRTR